MNIEDNINKLCDCFGIEPEHIETKRAEEEYQNFITQYKNATYEVMGIPIKFL